MGYGSNQEMSLTAKKVSKVKGVDADASFSIDGMDNGSFAIASSKKELKALMKSDAAVVYDEKKGKLYLNENGTAKGWGAKKVGGLIAKFKGKPELTADFFDGITAHKESSTNTGDGDISTQFKAYRDGLSDAEESMLYGETLIDTQKGIKKIVKDSKKDGYKFDQAELAAELDQLDKQGAFSDVELDAAALQTLMGQGGEQLQGSSGAT